MRSRDLRGSGLRGSGLRGLGLPSGVRGVGRGRARVQVREHVVLGVGLRRRVRAGRGTGRARDPRASSGGRSGTDGRGHHPALVGRERDATLAYRDVERALRDLAGLAEQRDLDAALVGLRELARDFLCDLRVLLAIADEVGERLLEGVEIELVRARSIGRRTRKCRGELDRELAHAILGERAEKSVGEAIEDALDGGVVRALAEHRADGLHEVTLDANRIFAAALGQVIEAARHAVDAHRVNADPGLDELRCELARDRDKGALLRRLGSERHTRARNLLLRHDELRGATDFLRERIARHDGDFRRPAEDATGHMPARSGAGVSNDSSAVVFADE